MLMPQRKWINDSDQTISKEEEAVLRELMESRLLGLLTKQDYLDIVAVFGCALSKKIEGEVYGNPSV